MSSLLIKNLHISVDSTEIVKGLSLTIAPGEVHAIMGPNGSGKSTLVNALMGHPAYEITKGSVKFKGKNLLELEPHERAQAGLFLAFQYPKEISGVSLRSFLFAAHKAQSATRDPESKIVSPIKFKKFLSEQMEQIKMNPDLAERSLNQGFSGGEKKKAEILQLKVLNPSLALLDETDSGLYVDALKIVAEGVNSMKKPKTLPHRQAGKNQKPNFSCLIVTHYARILEYIKPDKVHVMVNGNIVKSGGPAFAKELEEKGYEEFLL